MRFFDIFETYANLIHIKIFSNALSLACYIYVKTIPYFHKEDCMWFTKILERGGTASKQLANTKPLQTSIQTNYKSTLHLVWTGHECIRFVSIEVFFLNTQENSAVRHVRKVELVDGYGFDQTVWLLIGNRRTFINTYHLPLYVVIWNWRLFSISDWYHLITTFNW